MSDSSKDIYCMGICGTGVGALAGLLKAKGHRVRGSDQGVYPPMSDKLAEWGIEVHEGYDAAHLEPPPDLVVVGNVIRRTNPEAEAVRERELPFMSMPQAVAEFGIQDRHSVVVAGTHGKTTTTALLAHVLVDAGLDPSFLVGGALVGYRDSFRVGGKGPFVIEGDEYDTAYFDKGPKFVHYRARTAIITSLEFDHADIYDSVEAIEDSFAKLIATLPEGGHLVVWEGAERALRLAEARSDIRLTVYGEGAGADVQLLAAKPSAEGLVFRLRAHGTEWPEMVAPVWGDHSAQNLLACAAVFSELALPPNQVAAGLASYKGVKRRLEVLGQPRGVTVVDDFGHHPTAVRTTLLGARDRWPGQKLWALFEPRSATTRRNVFQQEFAEAFSMADAVVIGSHERLEEIPQAERFDPQAVAESLRALDREAWAIPDVDAIARHVAAHAKPEDVVMVFSNGAFGGLHQKLLDALES